MVQPVTRAPPATSRRRSAPTVVPRPPTSPTATWRPASVGGPWRSCSRSRTVETSSGCWWRACTRRSSRSVVGPTIPSTGRPALRWNSARAAEVASPKIPSTRPGSKPRAPRRCWSSATSSPRSIGVRRYRKRSPRRKPASTRVSQVWRPQIPSTRRPRRCWKASTADPGGAAEATLGVAGGAEAEGVQPVLDVGHRRPGVALSTREGGRPAAGTAVTDVTGSPTAPGAAGPWAWPRSGGPWAPRP